MCLAACLFPYSALADGPVEENKLSGNAQWILTLDNIISYNYGTGDLYEDYLERDYNRVSVNSNLVIMADLFITQYITAGLSVTGSMNWWGDHYETVLAGGPAVSFYFRPGESLRPFAQLSYRYEFYREYAGAGITREKNSFTAGAGLLCMVLQNTGIRLGASLSYNVLSVHNSVNGCLLCVSAGISFLL